MSDIAILKQMIKETATVPLEDSYGKKQVTLIEPQHNNYSVTIHGMPDEDEVIIIKADCFSSPDEVFKGNSGECKRADFVIVADTDTKNVIICIELKATKGSEKEIIQQLTGAQCFVAYCQQIGKAFWREATFLDTYQYRFVSIGHISISKQKTRIERPTDNHDRPEKMLKIDWPHRLEFNHLAGRKR
ncbi:hypothetical protein JYQ62_03610 [Nostoc sp. UHCC 0702]|nr:hypothetical protein JYQ62_03610 [Nostoc sp. UHCC 0702]